MAQTLSIETLLKRNREYAKSHEPDLTFAERAAAGLPMPTILVVTCTDPRACPEKFLQLQTSDVVLVMRNICGHVNPILNDILGLDSFIGLSDVLIIHHTDCGSTHFKNEDIRAVLKNRVEGPNKIDEMDFGAVDDLEKSVRDDIAVLKSSPLMRKELADSVHGFIFDIKTGLLQSVTPDRE